MNTLDKNLVLNIFKVICIIPFKKTILQTTKPKSERDRGRTGWSEEEGKGNW